jgi:hypothetical protein
VGTVTIGRRSVLAAGAAGLGLALLSSERAFAQRLPARVPRGAMALLDLTMDVHAASGELRLPQSYADELGLYTTGFTYDAALAILAYLSDGRAGSQDRALLLGESLAYAQQHDPERPDGRLRQAYTVGPYTRGGVEQPYGLVRPDGTVNIGGAFGFTASGTGECAWAGLALCELHRRTGDDRMVGSAVRLGEWIVGTCTSPGPLGGYTAGFNADGSARRQVLTALNADLVAFFGRLAEVTGDRTWVTHRNEAARFVSAMFDPQAQMFVTGSPDGVGVERGGPLLLEAQTHSWLALGHLDHVGCLSTVARRLLVTDNSGRRNTALRPGQQITGVTVSSASRSADPDQPIEPGLPAPNPDAVWLEGTAQYAVALAHSPGGALATTRRLDALVSAQSRLGGGQHVGDRPVPAAGGLLAASSPLHVGVVDSGYYPVQHVAATAWLVLAGADINPLRPGGGPLALDAR